jgi:hypothetical protein
MEPRMRPTLLLMGIALAGCHTATSSSKDMSNDMGIPVEDDMAGGSGQDLANSSSDMPALNSGASVLQMHNHASRDGVFIEPTFTLAAVAKVHQDPNFDGTYSQAGAAAAAYAQPLFLDNGGANDLVIVATEDNHVLAFNATTGKIKWHADPTLLGTAAPGSAFSCGNVDPSGITGTPVIDLATRAIFFETDVLAGGVTKHLIWSLSVDNGTQRAGWPIDVTAVVPDFASRQQGQRGGLIIVGNKVYVPFGGRAGDCTPYRGYVIGLPLSNPTAAAAVVFQTKAQDASGAGAGVGIWSPLGLASDGTSIYFATGNTKDTYPTDWTMANSEGVFRLPTSLAFSLADKTSYFAPPDWNPLDHSDTDISGSGVLLLDLPGAAKPHLAVVLGKDTKMYILDRTNLGGAAVTPPFSGSVAASEIINAPSVYTTTKATWVTFKAPCPGGGPSTVNAVQITNAAKAGMAWCANVQGGGSPVVSTTGNGQNTVVWWVSTEGEGVTGDYKLYGFDGDSGMKLVATAAMVSVRRFVSPIVAKGHVYVATDSRLYSFITP